MLSAPRLRAASLLVVVVSVAAACSPVKDATDWSDPKAKTHFLESCEGDTTVGNSTTTVVELGSKSFCTCVFLDLKSKHKLLWEDLLAYEKEQASAAGSADAGRAAGSEASDDEEVVDAEFSEVDDDKKD